METFREVAIAAGPVLGVVVGAALQHWFSRSAESRRQLIAVRSQAHTDYLRCLADSARTRADVKQRDEVFARAADAKTRVSVYGSASVVTALAIFERTGARIHTPQSMEAIMKLVGLMRQETAGTKEPIKADDLQLVLFGDSGARAAAA